LPIFLILPKAAGVLKLKSYSLKGFLFKQLVLPLINTKPLQIVLKKSAKNCLPGRLSENHSCGC
jgi:hypothetical protein